MDSVKRLTGISARLHSEVAAGASLIDELAKLAEAETDDMRAWADGGCQRPAPKGGATERQAIASKMTATSATAAAARGAIADTDAQIGQLSDRLRSISNEIDQAVFDLVERGHSDVIAEYAKGLRKGWPAGNADIRPCVVLQGGSAAVIFATKLPKVIEQFAAGVTALTKSYDAVSDTVAGMQKQLAQARAGVALVAPEFGRALCELP